MIFEMLLNVKLSEIQLSIYYYERAPDYNYCFETLVKHNRVLSS